MPADHPPNAGPHRLGGLTRSLGAVGDRWTLLVVAELLGGPQRFGELAASLGGIAPNVLTARLRQLERDGLIDAVPYSDRPVRLAYSLTDAGRELQDAIAMLAAWGARQHGDVEGPAHNVCGTPLETRLWCPTCERLADADPDAGDVTDEPVEWV